MVHQAGKLSSAKFITLILELQLMGKPKPMRIVRAVTALPSSSKSDAQSLLLQIENVALIPGKGPSSMVVASKDVTLSSSIYSKNNSFSEEDELEIRRRKVEIRKLDRVRILTAPFRHLNYLMWRVFKGFKSLIATEGFIYMQIKGKRGSWKISRNSAWALDNGKAIDRLVKHVL